MSPAFSQLCPWAELCSRIVCPDTQRHKGFDTEYRESLGNDTLQETKEMGHDTEDRNKAVPHRASTWIYEKTNMTGTRQNYTLTLSRLVFWRSGYREAAVARDLPLRAHNSVCHYTNVACLPWSPPSQLDPGLSSSLQASFLYLKAKARYSSDLPDPGEYAGFEPDLKI